MNHWPNKLDNLLHTDDKIVSTIQMNNTTSLVYLYNSLLTNERRNTQTGINVPCTPATVYLN